MAYNLKLDFVSIDGVDFVEIKMVYGVPFLIIPEDLARHFSKKFKRIDRLLHKIFKNYSFDLTVSRIKTKSVYYTTNVILSSLLYLVFFSFLFFVISLRVQHKPWWTALLNGTALGLAMGFLFFMVGLFYLKILAGKIAISYDKNLLFALKELLLNLKSGMNLYKSIVEVSKRDYGELSKEFKEIAEEISINESMVDVIDKRIGLARSKYYKKALIQLNNSIVSGANVEDALAIILNDLNAAQKAKVADYAKELNLWSLVYMLFAVALPSIGMTMLVILSSFSGIGVNETTMITFIVMSVFIQIVLVGLIKSRKPTLGF